MTKINILYTQKYILYWSFSSLRVSQSLWVYLIHSIQQVNVKCKDFLLKCAGSVVYSCEGILREW